MKSASVVISTMLILLCYTTNGICQRPPVIKDRPTPNSTNNYYYSGNWYYNQSRPSPGIAVEPHGQETKQTKQMAEARATPMGTVGDKTNRESIRGQDKDKAQTVRIVGALSVQRDIIDYVSLA